MRKIFSLLLVMLVLANIDLAKAERKLSFVIEPVYTGVKGVETKVGDIFYYVSEHKPSAMYDEGTRKRETLYEPIDPMFKNHVTLQSRCTYQVGEKWEIEARGWYFTSNAKINGIVRTPPGIREGDYFIYYLNGIRIWDHNLNPAPNHLEPSRYSPIGYLAENKIRMWSGNFTILRMLGEEKKYTLGFFAGAQVGKIEIAQNSIVNQTAFVFNAFGTGTHFQNDNELKSASEMKTSMLIGPVVGLESMFKFKGLFTLEMVVSQGVVFGEETFKALWRDTDNTYKIIDQDRLPYIYFTTDFPFLQKKKIAIPVTEGKIQLNMNILNTKKLLVFVGIGARISYWQDLSAPPRWSMPGDDWTHPGSGWKLSKNNLLLYSVGGNIGITF